ncbi:PepSY-associated TM helix domain-containing protein [Frateuria defendens]|uniref:PepSY-associated TM helix domain-containing protein n=1 Tax=Frateuria defendens TaxID=2219559 RepID=UPI00066FE72D|nr:PepSY-associated TM helix domain-containing protein [Frateuria defendens]
MVEKNGGPDRAFWLKQLHRWHWISSALCLVGMLLFAFTGLTLNHAGRIEAKPQTQHRTAALPAPLRHALATAAPRKDAPLPAAVSDWLGDALKVDLAGRGADWSDDEVLVSMPRPGGDAWVSIDRETGAVEYERTDRGWIAWLNDLHKGRHAGPAWGWFIDLFALSCLVFALSGLLLLKMHAAQRGATWPLVAFGVLLPLLLIVLFVH